MGILPGQLTVHLFGRDVLHLQKGVQDVLALAGQLELSLCKVIPQRGVLFHVFAHHATHGVA